MHAVLNFHCNLGIVFSLELQNSAELAVQAGHCSRVRIENRDGRRELQSGNSLRVVTVSESVGSEYCVLYENVVITQDSSTTL